MCKETLPHPVWTAGQEHREGLVSAALNSLETETKREEEAYSSRGPKWEDMVYLSQGVYVCVSVCVVAEGLQREKLLNK